MRIKEPEHSNFRFIINIYNFLKRYKLLGITIYSILIFMAGAIFQRTGFFHYARIKILSAKKSLQNSLIPITSNPEHIFIDIEHQHFQKLRYDREVALSKDLLVVDEYVPAEIRYKNKTYGVNLRLKGDFTDHLQGDKWSFRIRVKGDNTMFGMKQFSIHEPKTRNYIYEWIFHQTLKREDVLSLRYDFINVTLNGKDLGIYALEEHFEKRLVEHNQRREGPIIRFTEDLVWVGNTYPGDLIDFDTETYLVSEVDAFQTNKLLQDSLLSKQFNRAVYLLESFRRQMLKTSDVFELRTLSRFLAVSDLFGAQHANRWHNKRFYYNPVIDKLEPIGFDADAGMSISSLIINNNDYLNQQHQSIIFKDRLLLKLYIQELERISRPEYLNNLLDDLNQDLDENLRILESEIPYAYFDRNLLSDNRNFIRAMLNPERALHAYYIKKTGSEIELSFGNIQSLPVEVLSISLSDSITIPSDEEIFLPAKNPEEPVDYQSFAFTIPENMKWSEKTIQNLRVVHRVFGTSNLRFHRVFPWNVLDRSLIVDDLVRQPANIHDFGFLSIDEETKRIRFKPGHWKLSRNMIIPEGYDVKGGEGLKINLTNSAKILSFSPLHFTGSEEYPISIFSSDTTGQGIIVINANAGSLMEYVHFINLSYPSQKGWELTGAVTFYESPVRLSHCIFSKNRSEDALNIIRSDFEITESVFSENVYDDFDADFCKGKIEKTFFIKSGNDALDISGSVVNVNELYIEKSGDKAVSVGENSRLMGTHIEIKYAEIGLASKDMSYINVEHISMDSCKVAFAVYQKKPEFGPGNINVSRVEMENIQVPYLVETNSHLTIDDKNIKSNRENVDSILYGVEYGKRSK